MMDRAAGHFRRVEPRTTSRAFVSALLAPIERKTCWQLAEQAGHARPERMQRLLRTAVWDADALRNEMHAFATGQLTDSSAVLVLDETGFLKKGHRSVGVKRPYFRTAGRFENCQGGVFASYVTATWHAVMDRELYLPEQCWCAGPVRCERADVPASGSLPPNPKWPDRCSIVRCKPGFRFPG